MSPQRHSRKVHVATAKEEEVWNVRNVQLPEELPPGVSLAVQMPSEVHQQGESDAIREAKLELEKNLLRRARNALMCKWCSGIMAGSLALAGFVILSGSLIDVLALAPAAQAKCSLQRYEYPEGYPKQVEEAQPCPSEPACLFQVKSDLHGFTLVRNWNVPWEIPLMAEPGERFSVLPPHEAFSCCPITPRNCCGWYDANTSTWCDSSGKPNCPENWWPCYFEKEESYGGADAADAELDGSFLKLGEKTRSLPDVFVGLAIFMSGMLILRVWIKHAAYWQCIESQSSKLSFKIWIWTLKAIKRMPKWMLPEPIVVWWKDQMDLLELVQKCIRNWILRTRNKDQFIKAKTLAFWGNQVVSKIESAEDFKKNVKRATMIPTVMDQEQKKSDSDGSLTEKDQKRKKGSNSSKSTGSSASIATATSSSSEQPSRQKSGNSKESTKAAAALDRQPSKDEKQSGLSTTRMPDRQELIENTLIPKATKKTRSRKLLYDSGDMHNFKRLSRVRVVSEPWQRLCVEVALEEGSPQFGAFVRVIEQGPHEEPLPPYVSRVLRCSMAAENGVQVGFELLKVNRLVWPNFPAEEMVQELQSGRRPLFLVLQEHESRESSTASPFPPLWRPSSASRPLPPGASSSAPAAPKLAPPAMPGDAGMPSSYDLEAAALALPGEAARPQFDPFALEIRNSNGSVRPMAQAAQRPHSAGTLASNMRIADAERDRRRPMSAAALDSLNRTQNWQRRLSLDSNASSEGDGPAHYGSSSRSRRGHGGGGQQQAAQQRQHSGMSHSSGSNAGRRSRPGSAASARSNSRKGQAAWGPDEWLRPASAGSSKLPGVVGGRESDQKQQQQQKRPPSAASASSRPPSGARDRGQERQKALETSEALGSLLGF